MNITLVDFVNFLKENGPYAPTLALLYMLIKGYLIPLARYEEMKADRNFWRNLALELLDKNDETLTVAEKIARTRRKKVTGTDNADKE